jgi:O-antigen biosynthesis protein WbqV
MRGVPLNRPELQFDAATLRAAFDGKRVLVTGAAGSVGGALARQLAAWGCARLGLLDQYDHGLLEIVERLGREHPKQPVTEQLCDIRDAARLTSRVREFRPDIVLHSAALKHVHMGERHPGECVLANLIGVRNMANAAAGAGATDFVLVSSDKAAAPVCVMGATKRLAELYLHGRAARGDAATRFKSVRFGNVWGSQGSVLPRFAEQIESGGPLLVTHPAMERYFMSSAEAVGLILSVAALDNPDAAGAYFMEMGEPQSILAIGQDMIRKSGREIEIKYTGLRPGEKISEQLFDEHEHVSIGTPPNLLQIAPLGAHAYVSEADLTQLELAARSLDDGSMRQRVFALLDERLQRESKAAG